MKKCLSAIGMVALAMIFGVATAFAAETRGLSVIVKDPATGQPAGEVKLYGKAYAVLIGIDKYSDQEIPRLKNAVSDAKGIRKVLEQRFKFDQFITLYDEEATQKRIMELFKDELADKVSEDDAVFVFWAGHGTQQENTKYGDLGYLIPYDGSWKRHSRNISMETIKTDISKSLKARHVFYVMDACYGGLMTDKRAINPQTNRDLKALQQLAREDVRQVLTAGARASRCWTVSEVIRYLPPGSSRRWKQRGISSRPTKSRRSSAAMSSPTPLNSTTARPRNTANSTARVISFSCRRKSINWRKNKRK